MMYDVEMGSGGKIYQDVRTSFHDDRFRYLSNITIITTTI
jgi:hypothetical protein